MSEALIFASTNPQYDDRLFIELQVQYVHENSKFKPGENILTFRTIGVHNITHNMFSPGSAKRRNSDKDIPVCTALSKRVLFLLFFFVKEKVSYSVNKWLGENVFGSFLQTTDSSLSKMMYYIELETFYRIAFSFIPLGLKTNTRKPIFLLFPGSTHSGQIAKTRQKLHSKKSWNWVGLLVSATIWQV